MTQDRLGAMTPEASALVAAADAASEQVLGDTMQDTMLRELIARAAAPLLGKADLGDWRHHDDDH